MDEQVQSGLLSAGEKQTDELQMEFLRHAKLVDSHCKHCHGTGRLGFTRDNRPILCDCPRKRLLRVARLTGGRVLTAKEYLSQEFQHLWEL